MGMASVLGAALALALAPAARRSTRDGGRLIAQIAVVGEDRREHIARAALAALRGSRSVRSARVLGEGEVARLVAPYLDGVDAADLPLPTLIEARLAPRADADAVRRPLEALGARVIGAEGTSSPVARLIATSWWIASGVGIVAAGGFACVALIAARVALAGHGATIGILRDLGATDRQLARTIAPAIERDIVAGAAVSLALALAAIAFVGGRVTALDAAIGLGWTGWLGLVLLPVVLVAMALIALRLWLERGA